MLFFFFWGGGGGGGAGGLAVSRLRVWDLGFGVYRASKPYKPETLDPKTLNPKPFWAS